jgi:4-hydroxybenzoate polyprenyltransferase
VSETAHPPIEPQGPNGPVELAVALIKGMRPKQWAKQVFCLAGIIFSMNFLRVDMWLETGAAIASFSCLASCGYLINDLRDREEDRRHPKKRFRPIASGKLPVPVAWVQAALLFAAGCAIALAVSWKLLVVALLYFTTTVTYSMFWKHVVILDIMFLAAGFLWRAVAGAVAIDVVISPWLLLCTGFVSLFLGFNKRRILQEYSHDLVVELQSVTTSGTIISYALYTVLGSPTPWMLVTLPYLLYGIFRYMYLVSARSEGGAPEETLFKDPPILVTGVLYGITVVIILALHSRGVLGAM